MTSWRWTALLLLFALVGVPLAMPFVETYRTGHGPIFANPGPFLLLLRNTTFLIGGTLALALPAGTAAAVLLYRTDLPGRHFARFLVVLTLFVPLPVLTTGWQLALGNAHLWTDEGRRWAEGLSPAIWIHAQAALPWVILIVGRGLLHVEPELEEDALLATGPWRVLTRVTLPRCKGAIAAAGMLIALQVNGEVGVADLMMVDTFAREVYNQLSLGGGDSLARAVMLSLPVVFVTSISVYWLLMRLDRLLPPLAAVLAAPRPFELGRLRWPFFALTIAGMAILAGVPLHSLIWKTGLSNDPLEWSWSETWMWMERAWHGDGELIAHSVATMLCSVALVASVALVLCWLAQGAPWFRRLLFIVLAVAWSMPGPIAGIGLKESIMSLLDVAPWQPLATALYFGPSPLPVLWAHLIRFLPLAVVALWPVVRLIPRELQDAMRLDGASPLQELRHLVWPLLWRTWLGIVIVIGALALAEVGAVAMRVETPGWYMFAHVLFDRMHYGQAQDVTALCLVLLLLIASGGLIVSLATRVWSRLNLCESGPSPIADQSHLPSPRFGERGRG